MGKPRMIILVRHAQSEGNKNRDIHQSTPDHRVKLTSEGHRQAQEAGKQLRSLLNPDDTLHFFTSPYRRTRETTEGILDSLTSDSPSPSPFTRDDIKVHEEPRLREQDFGNFQPCSKEMERMWMERADYGHFFYRIPNGESAADAYDRVSGFNETLWRLFGEKDCASVCVLVTHGLMARVFLMKWYHWSVEHFEDLRNINHCEFVVMTHNQESAKYELQNKLRTWSDMRRDRDRERTENGLDPIPVSPVDNGPMRRKWGGCPDGCTHGLSADAKKSLRTKLVESKLVEYLRHDHGPQKPRLDEHPHDSTISDRPSSTPVNHTQSHPQLIVEGQDGAKRPMSGDSSSDSSSSPHLNALSRASRPPHIHGIHRNSEDHLLHPPSSISSAACLKLALLHLGGRDGGGSMSGANSLCPSDDESEDHDHHASPWITSQPPNRRSLSTHVHPLATSNSPPRTHPSQTRPSSELEHDGDDELSASATEEPRRAQNHHHHHHHHHHHYPHTHHRHASSTASRSCHRMANILGDGDDLSTHSVGSNGHSPSSSETHTAKPSQCDRPVEEDLSLEAQQKQDQSIHGSVY